MAFDERSAHVAGTDRVAGDAGLGDFERDSFGEPDLSMFGGDVSRFKWRCDETVGRDEIDDAAPITRLHAGQGDFDRMVAGVENDVLNGGPFFVGKLIDGRDVLDAGVVDEDVDGTEFRFGSGDESRDFVGLAHIGTVIGNGHAVLVGDFRANFFDFSGITKTVEHDMSSLLSESSRDAQTDPAGGSGDDGVFIFKHGVRLKG